ncbi:ferric reductase-like transmembrane domain-containing protein [Rhodobacter sp. Har01]|uniref:sulfite oxidase heme-binding subunit YedZ n=1 Tax=Rhodobacter sp. Har01 TaxID=2883999 RepID=UPI001D08F268|nr:ferric reductase-like transmembrane domain-containing protein [Rhodobacter sp. Har01]MCB6177769.1 ferric reductase-like transmembrane domain-containing protein [Rhodobacter sp. Har01]
MASRTRSSYILWAVMALPALGMIGPLLGDDARAFHHLLHPTGEWSARLMIIGMMASGLMLLFRGRSWPRWLLHHRRDIEVAAFLYAAVHTWVYVVDRGTLERILAALPHTDIWTGWLAFLIFIPLAVTSNDVSQRWLSAGWKRLQKLAYPAAVLVLIHWAALHNWGSWPPAAIHFGPLIALWAYRVWYWYLRPRSPQAPA